MLLKNPLPTSSPSPCWPRNRLVTPGRRWQHRSYATVHDGKPSHVPKWPLSAHPTPYEIFGLTRDAPYSKARYFELAKLYHPDRQHQTSLDGISRLTKLERYRLVVAANEILSNPQKKRMYDLYGFGWGDCNDSHAGHQEAYRAWRQDPIMNNATWEDWERYYQQGGSGEKQEQVFTSNIAFMAIISAVLIVGTWSQMTRAGTNSVSLMEMRDQQHAAISKELRELRNQRRGLDKETRVQEFIRQREIERWAYDPPGHTLPAPSGKKAD
ncbi:hypothetical protein N657DRAFT_657470 [Parathielavia appendiculata]|uniref:J domain-containing protein n=1 Tax=Parathielavia appendiculata TaxID=2587402 RepID=A0AAN6TY41_9PEZI|nr:hypothetical protein N657DRAFT_657470 [Parathielavia appendiculata]